MIPLSDGLNHPQLSLDARQVLATVCIAGGAQCPLLEAREAENIAAILKDDASTAIRITSSADALPHYTCFGSCGADADPEAVFNRKRDLDVLQRLGLTPGTVVRARYLYELLFERLATPDGICAYDTENWSGCPHARSGAYERVRAQGWQAMVHARSEEEMKAARAANAAAIATAERLYIRPHHLMCYACSYAGGENPGPRPNDTLHELFERMRNDPDVPVTLVEGCCMACDCCDGFVPENGRCVHAGGLIRDYKKDLDVFQKLGLMPGATLPARELVALVFERIPSTRDICAYGTGTVTAHAWSICGGPDGNAGYAKSREKGVW